MAARLWRLVVGCSVAIAAACAAALWCLFPLSWQAALAVGFGMTLFAPTAFVAASFLAAVALGHGRRSVLDGYYLLRALLSEIVDFNLLVFAMLRPSKPPTDSPGLSPARASRRPVLLIHGVACNHSAWNAWRARLERSGFAPVRVVDLEPPLADIEVHAARLEREVRVLFRESGGCKVAIIAHSMGGLVARAVLRRVGPEIIERIVTIATPHHGTVLARFLRWPPPLQQMCPKSSWLNALNAQEESGTPVPITSIYSLEDNLVVPARSAALRHARLIELRGVGHMGVLSSPSAIDCTVAALAGATS